MKNKDVEVVMKSLKIVQSSCPILSRDEYGQVQGSANEQPSPFSNHHHPRPQASLGFHLPSLS